MSRGEKINTLIFLNNLPLKLYDRHSFIVELVYSVSDDSIRSFSWEYEYY